MDRNQRAGLIAAIGRDGAKREFSRSVRTLMTNALRNPVAAVRFIRNAGKAEEIKEAEFATWVEPEAVAGTGGPFFGLDLRCWIALAEAAGVETVPARTILTLTDAEMDALSSRIDLSELTKPYESHRQRLAEAILAEFPEISAESNGAPDEAPMSREARGALHERLAAALDDLPANTMVRSVETGPPMLKTLVGVGATGDRAPEVPADPNDPRVGIGPGWIRIGNRRLVHVGDARSLNAHFEGPMEADHVFVARPWVRPARWLSGTDPHLAGTFLHDDDARWPVEWRAFIYDGKVTGVSAYYAWAGRVTTEDARAALHVRELAQRIADTAVALNALPRSVSFDLARHGPISDIIESDLPRDGVHATIDFIEAVDDDGRPRMLMLEAGPAYHPMLPGGHPCGFAGIARPEGVAFRTMDGVNLAKPETYQRLRSEMPALRRSVGNIAAVPDFGGLTRDGAVLDWSAVADLAARPVCAPAADHAAADDGVAPAPGAG